MQLKRLSSIARLSLACVFASAGVAHAQETVAISGDRLSGFVLPIEPLASDTSLRALRASTWTVDDTKRLLLSGDVQIKIGSYTFVSDQAVLWINRIPSGQGVINQIAAYFDAVSDPSKPAGLGVKGQQLLVTASTRGEISLNVALLKDEKPPQNALLRGAEARLADYLKGLAVNPPPLHNRPQLKEPQQEPAFEPIPGGRPPEEKPKLPRSIALPPTTTATPWLSDPQGIVRFAADSIEIARGEQENTITALGNVVFEYITDRRNDRLSQFTLSAERAIIFTDPGPLTETGGQLDAEHTRGIYLEGNVSVVAHDGQYIVRAPFVYYDFRANRAIMLDALLRLQQRGTRVPIYARAQEMRQLAVDQWQAEKVTVSTSEFFQPHLAIGSRQATITNHPVAGHEDQTETYVDAKDNTLEVAGVPIFGWSRFQGDVEKVPVKRIEVGARSNDGLRLLTEWNLYSLAGEKQPDGLEAYLRADAFTKRGGGGGLDVRYDRDDNQGRIDLYGLYDQGVDRTSSGENVDPENDFRGVAILEHQARLSEYWSMQAQLSLISDRTFISAWRENDFLERREYETSLYLKHQRDNAAFDVLGKYSPEDFLSNDYLLASRQYAVDKLPEITYRRYGDSLFDNRVTYSMENRVTRMRLLFEHATPNEIGVPGAAFGIPDTTNIADALKARGLRENWVDRVDSRHELALPMHLGAAGTFNVMPFIVGRFTGYDDDFETFSSDSDTLRFFGAAGVRANMQFQHVDNSADNELLDIHRLRHLIEPYVTLWTARSTVNQDDLPVYDQDVESLADGSAVQIGVRNTLQTQRGGPGRWRSVDVLMLDTSVVFDSQGKPDESPTPQFFDYRPEYSQFGDHVKAQAIWQVSDSLALVGEGTYTLDPGALARGSIGAELRHSPVLTTYIEYRYIEVDKNELLGIGWTYQLTPKYRIQINPQYDFRFDDFRSLSMRLTRSFPDFDFTLQFRYDKIRNDTAFGASVDLAQF